MFRLNVTVVSHFFLLVYAINVKYVDLNLNEIEKFPKKIKKKESRVSLQATFLITEFGIRFPFLIF